MNRLKWIRTVGELKKRLEQLPDDKEFVVLPSEGVFVAVSVDEWFEGVSIVCRTPQEARSLSDQEKKEGEWKRIAWETIHEICNHILWDPDEPDSCGHDGTGHKGMDKWKVKCTPRNCPVWKRLQEIPNES